MDNILSMLGLCMKAGALESGEDACGAAARDGKAAIILIACDAGSGAKKRAENYAHWGGAPLAELPYSREELGELLGKSACAIMAIKNKGMAASFMTKLAAAHEEYRETAETLQRAAGKAKQSGHSTGRGRKANA